MYSKNDSLFLVNFINFFHNHGYQDQQDTCSYFQGEQFYQTNILLQN